jgi:hypothetical protein
MAIYCKEIRLVYISAWVSGCTSVETFLKQHYGGIYVGKKHSNLANAIKKLKKQKERVDDLLKVVNIRNPFDMMVSFYYKDRYRHYPEYLKTGSYPPWMHPEAQDHCTWAGDNSVSFKQYLKSCGNLSIKQIKDERINCHIAFEFLQNDIDAMLATIGIKNHQPLPHCNKTEIRQKDFRQYYDDESKAIVELLAKKYLELTGYTFNSAPTGRRISGLRIQRPKPLKCLL